MKRRNERKVDEIHFEVMAAFKTRQGGISEPNRRGWKD